VLRDLCGVGMGSHGSYADRVRGTSSAGSFDFPRQNVYRGRTSESVDTSATARLAREGASEDVNMADVIESQGTRAHGIHPTKAQPEEKLPEGFRRNYARFLLRNLNREVEVNQDAVKHEMEFLVKFATIACFVGGRPSENLLKQWLGTLGERVDGVITMGRNLGKGFFLLKANHGAVAKKLLPLTPYRSAEGMCVFQSWKPGFDPSAERSVTGKGLMTQTKIPTWVTLRQVPEEFQGVSHQIAAGIGEVLGADDANGSSEDPKFCLALDSGAGWEPSVVVTNSISETKATILIDYHFLPIRCRYCFSTEHCIKDCSAKNVNMQKKKKSQGPNRYQRGVARSRAQPEAYRQSKDEGSHPLSTRFTKHGGLETPGPHRVTTGASTHTGKPDHLADNDGFQTVVSSRHRRNGKGIQRWDVRTGGEYEPVSNVRPKIMVGGSSSSPVRIPSATSPTLPAMQQVASLKKVNLQAANGETPTSRPRKEVELVDLNTPHVLSGTGGERTGPKKDDIPPVVGMSWSPEKIAGKKRVGCIILLSDSETRSDLGTQELYRQAASQSQDLNLVPNEGEGQAVSAHVENAPEKEGGLDRDTRSNTLNPEGSVDLFSPNQVRVEQDGQEVLSPSQNWATSEFRTPGAVVGISSSLAVGSGEQREVRLEPVLTMEEEVLLAGVRDPPPQLWWQMRDMEGVTGTFSAPSRLSNRNGKKKLTNIRSRAAPYSSGVFRSRMEVDLRVPVSEYGALKVIQISKSPTSPRSGASLPFP
jgi:hypothetical protein